MKGFILGLYRVCMFVLFIPIVFIAMICAFGENDGVMPKWFRRLFERVMFIKG